MPPAGSKLLSAGSSPSTLPASPLKSATPFTLTGSPSRPAAVSSALESVAYQNKSSLPAAACGPPATAFPPPALVPVSSNVASSQKMAHGSSQPSMASATPDEKPGTPNLGTNFSSAALAPNLMSLSGSSPSTSPASFVSTSAPHMSVSKSFCDPAPTNQSQMYSPPAAESRLSTASPASVPPVAENLPSLAAHGSPTVRPLSALPLQTTQASWTAPVSSPPALVSVPPAASASSGEAQSSGSVQDPPDSAPPRALKSSSPKPEHHGRTEDANRNRKPEEQPAQCDLDTRNASQTTEIDAPKSLKDLPVHHFQTPAALDRNLDRNQTDSEKRRMQTGVICGSDDPVVDQTPVRRPSRLYRVENVTEDKSRNNSSQFGEYSTLTTPSRTDVSSGFEKSSLADDSSSCVDASTDFDSSIHPRKGLPQLDSTTYTEEGTSTVFETTAGSISSVQDSRNDTIDSTGQEEIPESEGTDTSSCMREDSMVESSLHDTSQMEEPSVDSSDVSQSQPSCTGTILNLLIIRQEIISHIKGKDMNNILSLYLPPLNA